MMVRLNIELTSEQLTQLAQLAGKSFMSGDDIEAELADIVRRELAPGVDLGFAYRITYYREDADEPYGFKLYSHVFGGPHWPHIPGRPRIHWDGRGIRSRGGAVTVTDRHGFIDDRPEGEEARP